jgi:hypothetical protein
MNLKVCCRVVSLHLHDNFVCTGGVKKMYTHFNTLRTGDTNLRHLRFCVTTVKYG